MSGKSIIPGRGRKPKPNKQKLLSGSKHAKSNAVEFELINHATPPEWLDDLATMMWETICPKLCQEKVLAVTDLHNVEAFCSAYSTFRLSINEIQEKGLRNFFGMFSVPKPKSIFVRLLRKLSHKNAIKAKILALYP